MVNGVIARGEWQTTEEVSHGDPSASIPRRFQMGFHDTFRDLSEWIATRFHGRGEW